MGVIHLFVEFGDHHRLDDGQQFSHDQWRDVEGITQCQCSRHVPADNRARQQTQLSAKTADKIPDLPAFKGGGAIQPRWAVFADFLAGLAVLLAPAEGPLGKGAETFFSCSSSRPFET